MLFCLPLRVEDPDRYILERTHYLDAFLVFMLDLIKAILFRDLMCFPIDFTYNSLWVLGRSEKSSWQVQI